MTKVEVKHKWECPKCGEKINIREMVNRENKLMYFKLLLIIGLSSACGCLLTIAILSLIVLAR